MEDTQEMESGLTLGEIFKVIFKRIWWVLGAALVCLAVVLLVTQLWYNKKNEYYSVSYDMVFPGIADGKYPDGSDLIISDSIKHETLKDIKSGVYSKENPDEFKGIDVDDMYADDGISLSERVVRSEGGSVKMSCTLTVQAKYFSSKAQAYAFMRVIAEYPVTRVNALLTAKDYAIYLSVIDDAPTYDEVIATLLKQKTYLQDEYTKLKAYGEVADVGIASLHNIFTTEQQNEIRAHILADRYVLNTAAYKAEADTQKASLNLQIANNKIIIDKLRDEQKNANTPTDTAVVTDPYEERIADLTAQNGELLKRIDTIEKTLEAIDSYTADGDAKVAKQAFDTRLNDYRAQLDKAATTLKTVSMKIYSDNSRIVFSNNKLEKEGGISWLIAAILGILLGAVVAAIVVCIIDLPKYKREKLAAAAGSVDGAAESEGVESSETVPAKDAQE